MIGYYKINSDEVKSIVMKECKLINYTGVSSNSQRVIYE